MFTFVLCFLIWLSLTYKVFYQSELMHHSISPSNSIIYALFHIFSSHLHQMKDMLFRLLSPLLPFDCFVPDSECCSIHLSFRSDLHYKKILQFYQIKWEVKFILAIYTASVLCNSFTIKIFRFRVKIRNSCVV